MAQRTAPEAFGLAIVDVFSCAFLVCLILFMLESPLPRRETSTPDQALQLVQTNAVRINAALVAENGDSTVSVRDVNQWIRDSKGNLVALVPTGAWRTLTIAAVPENFNNDITVQVLGNACPGARTVLKLERSSFYRARVQC